MATTIGNNQPYTLGVENSNVHETKSENGIVDGQVLVSLARRLKFLLSDASLRRNAHLQKWFFGQSPAVPVRVLMQWKSIRELTTDSDVLVKAVQRHLKGSLEVVDLPESEHYLTVGIQRVNPFTMDPTIQVYDQFVIHRTLVIGNLPALPKHKDDSTPLRDLENSVRDCFEVFGEVFVEIRTRRFGAVPRGSGLVEFENDQAFRSAVAQTLTFDQGVIVTPQQNLHILGHEVTVSLLQDVIHEHEKQLKAQEERYVQSSLQTLRAAKARRMERSKKGVLEIPQWKNLPFCPDQPVFLYKLSISSREQHQRTDPRKYPSNMGILFPIDLFEMSHLAFCGKADSPPSEEVYDAVFSLPARSGAPDDTHAMRARLSEKCAITKGLSSHELVQLRHFHRVLLQWKTYGVGYQKELDDSVLQRLQQTPVAADSALSSTCIFVPIIIKPNCGNDNLPSIDIDWSLIRQEVNRQTTPIRQWHRKQPSNLSPSYADHAALHRKRLYRVLRKSELTASSPFPTQFQDISQNKLDFNLQRFGLDLRTTTYAEYFAKKHNMPVRFLDEALVEARRMESLSDENWYLGGRESQQTLSQSDDNIVHLIPEYVEILAVPLSLLLTTSIAQYFMPALERDIELCFLAHRFRLCAVHSNLNSIRNEEFSEDGQPISEACNYKLKLVELLREATTLFPVPTYDRLEFLGDAVLSYYLSLFVIIYNAPFEWDGNGKVSERIMNTWDSEDSNQAIREAGRNEALRRAAKSMELDLLLFRHSRFRSCYSNEQQKTIKEVPIANKTLSDAVESILGAAFLAEDGDSLVLYFLRQLKIPFPGKGKADYWFQTWNVSINDRCLIASHSHIRAQICKISDILHTYLDVGSKLKLGQEKLLNLLLFRYSYWKEDSFLTVLIQCALFDDDLLKHLDNGQVGTAIDFLPIVSFRESLFSVGAFALYLMVSKELFQRFPRANSGELHLLRACAANDDVLAYVMVQNGLHECLYDKNTPSTASFLVQVQNSERIMSEEQKGCGPTLFVLTKYPALVGGRMAGSKDKKLSSHLTEDLSVSFKTIVGALVLSLGIERMWKDAILGLLDELLALDPATLCSLYRDKSSLVKTYESNRWQHS